MRAHAWRTRPEARFEDPAGALSGGQRTLAGLARLLVSPAELILLDAPTNHMVLGAREALEDTLRKYPGTLIVGAPDPAFVEALAGRELSRHGAQLGVSGPTAEV